MIRGVPKIGDHVRINKGVLVHGGLQGEVVEHVLGYRGLLLAVRVEPGRTVDVFWSRVRIVRSAH